MLITSCPKVTVVEMIKLLWIVYINDFIDMIVRTLFDSKIIYGVQNCHFNHGGRRMTTMPSTCNRDFVLAMYKNLAPAVLWLDYARRGHSKSPQIMAIFVAKI